VGSYPLSSQAPTSVEVELGCDKKSDLERSQRDLREILERSLRDPREILEILETLERS
jgi:hypothetical protein